MRHAKSTTWLGTLVVSLLFYLGCALPLTVPYTEVDSSGAIRIKDGISKDQAEEVHHSALGVIKAMYASELLPRKDYGHLRGGNLARLSMDKFLERVLPVLPAGSRCLEWAIRYSKDVQQCAEKWRFDYRQINQVVQSESLTIHANCDHMAPHVAQAVRDKFDFVFNTFVFEHVSRPWACAKALFSMVKPGGYVAVAAPFLERYHEVPVDNYRYTPMGVTGLFTDAGFIVKQSYIGGDKTTTVQYLMGYGKDDLTEEEWENSQLRNVTAWNESPGEKHQDLMYAAFVLFQKPTST